MRTAEQNEAMAQVCLDMHAALGVEWGGDPYAAIKKLKVDAARQPAEVQEPVALDEQKMCETANVLAEYLFRLSKAATPAPWQFGPLIEGQAGDYVIWKHRGLQEAEFPGPQREFVGCVGHFIQPIIAMGADGAQLFDGEQADSELITALRNNLPHILSALRYAYTHPAPDTVSVPTEEMVEAVARVIARSPGIDSPKLAYQCWMGLARNCCEAMIAAAPHK